MEQRKNQRLPVRLSGHLSIDFGDHVVTETRDVSLRGARVADLPATSVGQHCILTLFMEDAGTFSVTIEGTVSRQDEKGFAIVFESIDRSDFKAFKEYMDKLGPDHEALDKEVKEGWIPELEDWVVR